MTGRSWISWIWISQDERAKAVPLGVIVFNWVLAFSLLGLLCFFSFSQLRYNWNWDTVGGYQNFFWRGWLNTLKISSIALMNLERIPDASACASFKEVSEVFSISH